MKAAVKLALFVAFWCSITVARAADDPKPEPSAPAKTAGDPEKKSAKGRLPANYGKVVSEAQRAKIYQIQADYGPKLKALREQLNALTAQEDKEFRAVLTPEQSQKLDELIAEAKAKRKANRATETATKPVEPAKPTTTPPAKPAETAPPLTK